MARTRGNPDRTRGRHDVGHFLRRGGHHLHDAGGTVSQLGPGVVVGFKVGVGWQAARTHPHRALGAGGEGVGVTDWHQVLLGPLGHGWVLKSVWLKFVESWRFVAKQKPKPILRYRP
jgi:hypothetical protein